jgi:hypothetical protein
MLQLENRHFNIVQDILSKHPYQFYAYGSRTKGIAKKHSDLDLCYKEEIPNRIINQIEEELIESDLPFTFDLVA